MKNEPTLEELQDLMETMKNNINSLKDESVFDDKEKIASMLAESKASIVETKKRIEDNRNS